MKVLVVGAGGREHAIAWKLNQSKKVKKLYCAPGNGGMASLARCVNIKADDIKGLADFAQKNKIHLTVVGPEQPLANGIVDEFQRRKLRIFGPEKKAAELEGSKVFAKTFMQRYHIPTAPFKVFDSAAEAIGFCKSVEYPVVIKADGLAAGKGVSVVKNLEEATAAIEQIMVEKVFGASGSQVVVESFLRGQEVSIMALTDGKAIVPLLSSQDHKQAYEGDKGPNTGGMGAFCPSGLISDDLLENIYDHILYPTIAGLRSEKIVYRGVLYAGLMLTESGPKVLEYNCRFGDPETQAVLPLLKTDLLELLRAVVGKRLEKFGKLQWDNQTAACVIMASKGYPGKYKTGHPITGIKPAPDNTDLVFHAGTKRDNNHLVTSGGRVLGVVGIGQDLTGALKKSYARIEQIDFKGATFRRDIGFRAPDSFAGRN